MTSSAYKRAIQRLDSIGEIRMRMDLTVSQELLTLLGHPDQQLDSIVISGTNGKGSVAYLLAGILKEFGFRVGLYTSPHLETVRERIVIDGLPVSEDVFAKEALALFDKLDRYPALDVTYFEFLTMLSLQVFKSAKTDIQIFETGLGGRLDSTNVLKRNWSAITQIDLDHTHILGTTLPLIAREKAAVMRSGLPTVVVKQEKDVQEAFQKYAMSVGARLIQQDVDYRCGLNNGLFFFENDLMKIQDIRLGVPGGHQGVNAGCAVTLALLIAMSEEAHPDRRAIERALENTRIPGRMEKWIAGANTLAVWLDVAHNPAAAKAVVNHFIGSKQAVNLVIGMLSDKDWKACLDSFSHIGSRLILCEPPSPRKWNLEDAETYIRTSSIPIETEIVVSPVKALEKALEYELPVFCCGSFYTVGAIRRHLPNLGYRLDH